MKNEILTNSLYKKYEIQLGEFINTCHDMFRALYRFLLIFNMFLNLFKAHTVTTENFKNFQKRWSFLVKLRKCQLKLLLYSLVNASYIVYLALFICHNLYNIKLIVDLLLNIFHGLLVHLLLFNVYNCIKMLARTETPQFELFCIILYRISQNIVKLQHCRILVM